MSITEGFEKNLVLREGREFYLEDDITELLAYARQTEAHVEELMTIVKDQRDYLEEALTALEDHGRPRYERRRQLIRDDMSKADALLARIESERKGRG